MDTRKQLSAFLQWMYLGLVYSSCDVKIVLKSGQEFQLTSPNYPSNFSHNLHCFYDLTTEFSSGDILHVFVLDVTLSCDDPDNSLEVFDAFSTSPRYLGRVCAGGVAKFVSPKERLYLIFRSGSRRNSEASSRGFRLNVMSIPEYSNCYNHQAKVLPALSYTQHIVTPYYPFEVAPNVHCRWLLKVSPGYRVHLDVLNADMKGSSDCSNFGLYVFDGKTTYDDEKLGSVCSNNIQSFASTSNYLMVVFTSGPHVLHSGGGVKLGYYSSLVDSNATQEDSSLLFILIGVLLAIASFTIIMIILRVCIVPARRQALARRYNHSHRNSNISSSSVATITLPSDPPPPYQTNNNSGHRQKRSSLWASTCGCCFPSAKSSRDRHSQFTIRHFDSDFNLVSGHGEMRSVQIPPQILSALTGDSVNAVLNFLSAGTDIPDRRLSGEITSNRSSMSAQFNEYHELPASIRVGATDELAIDDDGVMVNRFSNCQTTRYHSRDSGYQESTMDVESVNSDNLYVRVDSDHLALHDLDNVGEDVSASRADSPREERNSGNSSNVSAVTIDNDSRTTDHEVDEHGYEIPISSHLYDRVKDSREEGEEEVEGVYHTLALHSGDL